MCAARYDVLSSDSAHCGDIELQEPVAAAKECSESLFSLRVLFKERVFIIQDDRLSADSTISDLKIAIQGACSIPSSQQRLIFSGRMLKPDDKKLNHFQITCGSSIHLFPIPEVISVTAPTIPTGSATPVDGMRETVINPLAFAFDGMRPREMVLPVHFDYEVARNARDVKMWSFVLVFLSTVTMINNVSLLLSSSKWLDDLMLFK